MAYAPKSRKRLQPPRRGPDGSAFQRCEECGVPIPIALSDMHKCAAGGNGSRKRSRGGTESLGVRGQPRSAFRFFIESFRESCEAKREVDEVDQRGFHLWKNMPMKQRQPYLRQAEKVNLKYERVLLEEVEVYDLSEVENWKLGLRLLRPVCLGSNSTRFALVELCSSNGRSFQAKALQIDVRRPTLKDSSVISPLKGAKVHSHVVSDKPRSSMPTPSFQNCVIDLDPTSVG